MEYSHYVLPALAASLIITVVILLTAAILYCVCRKLLISDNDNRQLQKTEKIPEENDERFATGKGGLLILHFLAFVIISAYFSFLPNFGILSYGIWFN